MCRVLLGHKWNAWQEVGDRKGLTKEQEFPKTGRYDSGFLMQEERECMKCGIKAIKITNVQYPLLSKK